MFFVQRFTLVTSKLASRILSKTKNTLIKSDVELEDNSRTMWETKPYIDWEFKI